MRKKIAALAAAVMLVSAVPAFAADSQDNQQNQCGPGYCYNNQNGQGCPNYQDGQNGHHRGGCWRNNNNQ